MVFVYILKLIENKYYVGKTEDPETRIMNHFEKNGSAWTKKYKTIDVIDIIKDCDDYDEDKYVLKYMKEYGVENVRGGSFCEANLSEENKNTISRMINGSEDKCYICGMKGHYVNQCKMKKEITTKIKPISKNSVELAIQKDVKPKAKKSTKKKNLCDRCGRKGHTEENCYATTDKDGDLLSDSDELIWECEYCDEEFDSEDDVVKHEKKCKNKYSQKINNKCFRCQREGHYSENCYATTNVYGKKIYDNFSYY
jgi:predicted GIY-YIG superfamily endonuclease